MNCVCGGGVGGGWNTNIWSITLCEEFGICKVFIKMFNLQVGGYSDFI